MISSIIFFLELIHMCNIRGIHVAGSWSLPLEQPFQYIGITKWSMYHIITMQLSVYIGTWQSSIETGTKLTDGIEHGVV